MSRKIIVCEGCDAVFKIQHEMDEHFYSVNHCPFCGDTLNSDNEDELFDEDDDGNEVVIDNYEKESAREILATFKSTSLS